MISPALSRLARKQDVVVIHRAPGARDRQGNPTWAETSRDTYPGFLSQESTRELVLGRETVVDTWRLQLRAGARIEASAQVLVGQRLFEVDGTPNVVQVGAGVHHIEAVLRFVKDNADA